MTIENMRREARVDARVAVVLCRGRKEVRLETSDVSFKGLFLCTSEPPPLRSLVRLKVALLGKTFEAHAMAVHIVGSTADQRAAGVGLQFWGLSGPARAAWDDFVRELVQERRAAAKRSSAAPPGSLPSLAASEPPTPSGVRVASGFLGPASSSFAAPASSPSPAPTSSPGPGSVHDARPPASSPRMPSAPDSDKPRAFRFK